MELKEFIKSALVDIVSGVCEAATAPELSGTGAEISPPIMPQSDKQGYKVTSQHGSIAFLVDFDLSIVVSETSQRDKNGSAKLTIATMVGAGVSASTQEADGRTTTQRVKFCVPVKFPQAHPSPVRIDLTDV